MLETLIIIAVVATAIGVVIAFAYVAKQRNLMYAEKQKPDVYSDAIYDFINKKAAGLALGEWHFYHGKQIHRYDDAINQTQENTFTVMDIRGHKTEISWSLIRSELTKIIVIPVEQVNLWLKYQEKYATLHKALYEYRIFIPGPVRQQLPQSFKCRDVKDMFKEGFTLALDIETGGLIGGHEWDHLANVFISPLDYENHISDCYKAFKIYTALMVDVLPLKSFTVGSDVLSKISTMTEIFYNLDNYENLQKAAKVKKILSLSERTHFATSEPDFLPDLLLETEDGRMFHACSQDYYLN